MMRIVRLTIEGRVQGVGFRAWTEHEAQRRGLDGWVRNRDDGSVEAVVAGDEEAVAGMVAACRLGPHGARVEEVTTSAEAGPVGAGFEQRATCRRGEPEAMSKRKDRR